MDVGRAFASRECHVCLGERVARVRNVLERQYCMYYRRDIPPLSSGVAGLAGPLSLGPAHSVDLPMVQPVSRGHNLRPTDPESVPEELLMWWVSCRAHVFVGLG